MKTIGYIRVSSNKQTCSNQHWTIREYARCHHLHVGRWVEETISSREPLTKRALGGLLDAMSKGDQLIITEISRLTRNLYELAGILQDAIKKEIIIISIKENYHFKNDIQSKIMAYTFGLAAEIERDLISSRTKMALDKLRDKKIKLGRPIGSRLAYSKLFKKKEKLKDLLQARTTKRKMAKILCVSPSTIWRYLQREKMIELLERGEKEGEFTGDVNDAVDF